MYEELYAALPDVDLYWKRLGISAPQGEPDRALLDAIVLAHQRAIPFENLDVCDYKKPISLGIPDLFDKMIRGTRGGYCFELNALFEAFLGAVGFKVAPCFARSLKDYGYKQPIMHRGALVSFGDERVYCDVGYGGPMPACSLPLEAGAQVVSQGQVFRVDSAEESWWHMSYCGSAEALSQPGAPKKDPVPVIAFLEAPVDTVDFVPLSHFCSTHPNSVFTQRRMVNRRTSDGNVSITADQFTKVSAGGKESRTVASEEEFRSLLAEYFDIVLPD